MEIVLLLILILLVVIFNSTRNNRLSNIEEQLGDIQKQLKKMQVSAFNESGAPKKAQLLHTEQKEPKPAPSPQPDASPPSSISVPPVEKKEPVADSQRGPEKVAPQLTEQIKVERTAISATSPKTEKPKQEEKPPLIPQEDWYTRFRKNNPDIEKFIGENLVSKIGVAILVIGIAFFVKYAIDKNWINEIARVGIGILCGGIVLGFAHRLRLKFKAFSSVLVAGGISIFYFSIGIAFHQYRLFDQTTAFIIMLLITGFSVFISIAYNRVELAALSLIGGFATPMMVSTGEGNYQVLFTYILILDIGMLVLAYMRNWNLINLMAYGFTMLLYFIWLESKVIHKTNAPYTGALLFAAIFYIVFTLMNIINNVKEKRPFKAIELTLLLSNTFLFYIAGMQVLSYYHPEHRGLFNLTLSIVNMFFAWLLYKKYKADPKLVYLLIGLTLSFITVAVPVQLDGHYITLAWSLEAVLLLWLSQRSGIVLYRFTSVLVTFVMLLSLLLTWVKVYSPYIDAPLNVIFNKGFITGLVSSLSMLGIGFLLKNEKENIQYLGITFHPVNYGIFSKVAFTLLLYLTGMIELKFQLERSANTATCNYIIIYMYHLLYVCAINLMLRKTEGVSLSKTVYLLNYGSLLLFMLGFVFLPIADQKYNLIGEGYNHLGFYFHYVSIIASLFLVYRLRGELRDKFQFSHQSVINSVLFAVSAVYLLSVELLLHVEQIALSGAAKAASNPEMIQLLSSYNNIQGHVVKIGFPILWGLLAFAFLFVGMKKHYKSLRVTGLVLIAIILLKLFFYDIRQASEAGKIVAFIILGIVLLVISFMYQKIKALLLDDRAAQPNTTETKT